MAALLVPSLSSFDLARLNKGLGLARQAGMRTIHVDVCDGHFTPGITVGQPVVQSLIKAAGIGVETHLLVERPERFLKDFLEAGVSRIAIHPESTRQLLPSLEEIRIKGAQAGVVLNPETPVTLIVPVLREVDFVILLCGESKAAFSDEAASNANMAATIEKLQSLLELRKKSGFSFTIGVEGSWTQAQGAQLEAAGADILIITGAIEGGCCTSGRLAHSAVAPGWTGRMTPEQPLENY